MEERRLGSETEQLQQTLDEGNGRGSFCTAGMRCDWILNQPEPAAKKQKILQTHYHRQTVLTEDLYCIHHKEFALMFFFCTII